MKRAVSVTILAFGVLATCESPTAPVGEGVFALESVVGGSLPWRIEGYSGRVFLVADTLRLDPGDRFRRTTVMTEERDPPAADSVRVERSEGEVLGTEAGWTLVTDNCRPDRSELSLCIAPDTVAAEGAGLVVASPLLGAELRYAAVR